MREIVDFRLEEEDASRFLAPSEGERLGDTVRRIVADAGDPMSRKIIEFIREQRRRGKASPFGWIIRRLYTKKELDDAELFHMTIDRAFEQPWDAYVSRYNWRGGCLVCGVGAPQVEDLVVDQRRIPRRGISLTYAREVVITRQVERLLQKSKVTGFATRAVRSAGGREAKEWRQLVIVGEALDMVPPTRVGDDPAMVREESEVGGRVTPRRGRPESSSTAGLRLVIDRESKQALNDWMAREVVWCPTGHLVGHELLSEVYLRRRDYRGSDLAQAAQYVGGRLNFFRPARPTLCSPRLRRILLDARVTGISFEVAHLV